MDEPYLDKVAKGVRVLDAYFGLLEGVSSSSFWREWREKGTHFVLDGRRVHPDEVRQEFDGSVERGFSHRREGEAVESDLEDRQGHRPDVRVDPVPTRGSATVVGERGRPNSRILAAANSLGREVESGPDKGPRETVDELA